MTSEDIELYAERLRLNAMKEAAQPGDPFNSTELPRPARVKLYAAWRDHTEAIDWHPAAHEAFESVESSFDDQIGNRIERSIGVARISSHLIIIPAMTPTDVALSLLEAEHEVLSLEYANANEQAELHGADPEDYPSDATSPEAFRTRVNSILDAHGIAFALTATSRIVPRQSEVLHSAVITPVLHLLHEQPQFQIAETTYQKALLEIRNGDGGDSITDACTALQETLKALGFSGNALGDQIKAAKKARVLGAPDAPLVAAIEKVAIWVANRRNHGEAHIGDADADLNDAWFIVHTIGAMIIYLSAKTAPGASVR
ncbi:hypothetical protein [Nocardia sp. 348MFTsu5.1]|uniref:hypothetical protein n=1 Tax=Nocardia sp. 348MFTsu5.1 TaxID=1172185 RepID=UPI000379CF68|nr:hypothetical protein [Nocardia sp. 348MFTsu5.1]